LEHWIIAKSASGAYLGAEQIKEPPDSSADTFSHALALTSEFQRLLKAHWSDSHWVMVDRHRYVIFRPDAGVLGTIILSQSPTDASN
jgi:hypothetical protein